MLRWVLTERLYYTDPSLQSFDAQVTRVEDAVGRWLVYLNRSAFYPTSGGQSHDLGTINDSELIDVMETPDGDVAHVVSVGTFRIGEKVHGEVDGVRRLKNRQQHTAQHILSHLFIAQLSAETVSVHLGDDYGAIELNAAQLSDSQTRQVEQAAASVVAANYPIEIIFASGDEIATLPLRKPPQREGTIRVIRIGQLDWSACGGTHCRFTSEVGIIKITGVEKIRGHAVVRFLAGSQAAADYQLRYEVTDTLARELTCHPSDLVGKVQKLITEHKQLRKDLNQAQKELLPARAKELAAKGVTAGTVTLVAELITGIDGGLLSSLATLVATDVKGLVMLMCEGRIAIASAEASGIGADWLARELGQKAGLKGGGNARIAQLGGGDDAKFSEYRNLLLTAVQSAG
jgi:alanyl-tRNA synthetase